MTGEKETATVTAPEAGERMTFEEFLDRGPEGHAEWVHGEVKRMSPLTEGHQDIADFLTSALRYFAEERQRGRVLSAPFAMLTGPDMPAREPDILFLAAENHDRLKRTRLEGPADLVVEIISPESRGRDRGDMFFEYEQGGVREYWLIDTERRQAEFYVRDERGIFATVPAAPDGIFHSAVLDGLWLRVEWLWQDPLPTFRSVLEAWDLL